MHSVPITTKTGRHDYIAESGIKTPKIKSINHHTCIVYMYINGDKCCQVMAVTHDHDPLSQV
jgi:hypothetical protein